MTATAAAFVQERKIVPPQIVTFKSDSLELSLYDNGEIDGDTVSLLLNGEILLARQGLKATAIKKTIYIRPGDDEVGLVLYAENLANIRPILDYWSSMMEMRYTSCGSVPIYSKMHPLYSGESGNVSRLGFLLPNLYVRQTGLDCHLISPLFNFLTA